MEQKWYQKNLAKKWWFWAVMIACGVIFIVCIATSKPDRELATEKAQHYIECSVEDIQPYSRKQLIDRLKRDGFSAKDAIYAVDNCGADWNEQAVLQAAIYLKFSPTLSDEVLFNLLIEDGYTTSQATHGLLAKNYYN